MKALLIVPFLVLAACASQSTRSGLPSAVVLEFRGKPGETTDTRYYSNAHISTYEGPQLIRDRLEGVDFTVASHVSEFEPVGKLLKFEVRTTRKDGSVDLHDLAFPELNEEIEYVIRSNGEVLKAGRFPPQSLFYVPSMPIPKGAVAVGDTWTMSHVWYSAHDAVPLQLDVVGILKEIMPCEGGKVCADVEVSGHVNLVNRPTTIGSKFESRLWGRLLFSLERGDVIWSEMRSEEEFGVPGQRMAVRSCMLSETDLGRELKTKFACDPDKDEILKTPAL
jgi:hypothetical protein